MGFIRYFFMPLLGIFITFSLPAKAPKTKIKALCWDLCYTLCKPSPTVLLQVAGTIDFGMYTTWDGKGTDQLRSCINDVLSLSGTQKMSSGSLICDCYGDAYAQLTVDLFSGKITAQQALDEVLQYTQELNNLKYFYNEREYRLCTNTLNFMFDAKNFAESIQPYEKSSAILEKYSRYTHYILTNWNEESFVELRKNKAMNDIFTYCDREHCFISGQIGYLAPQPEFYQAFLKKYNLKPEECLVIDDQEENIIAAQKCGMHAHYFKNNNFELLEKKLQEVLS
ncbi:MAG: HAD-IA family hydrolase [Candidatus Babeliaceae bacterium]